MPTRNDLTAAQNIGNLNGDADYRSQGSSSKLYRFSLDRSSRLKVSLNQVSGKSSLQLLKADGSELKQNRKSSRLKSGDYYVQVNAEGNAQYKLNLQGSGRAIDAGDEVSQALDAGTLSGVERTFRQRVGGRSDRQDFYQIDLTADGVVDLSLKDLRRDADLMLLDENGEELVRSSTDGKANESIRQTLNAGTYFVQVSPFSSRLKYTLTMAADGSALPGSAPVSAPSSPNPAIVNSDSTQNSPIFSQSGQVSATKSSNFYRFSTNQSGIFTADLTSLTGDADVRLVKDANNNGKIDQGEVLAWQWERGTGSESIRKFVGAGNYLLQVMSYNNQTANYNVSTNFTNAASDDRQFSIRLNYGTGLGSVSDSVRGAIAQAAKIWENVISYSSFNGSHTLDVEVIGESNPDNWYAAATNKLGIPDKTNKWMPTTGRVRINTSYANTFNDNPEYLTAILTHEFAHVLGIGTLWENNGRNLIDAKSDSYASDSYAGLAYGDLTGTFSPTAIPLSKDKDATGKSIYGHWSESVFGDELLTPEAEGAGVRIPLSQVTIASLRDIGWNVNYGAAEAFLLSRTASPVNNTISSLPPDSNDLFIRCGCATHMAQSNGINLLGSSRLSDVIQVM
jgi:Bacterial pre-peptidase C-terminal domain